MGQHEELGDMLGDLARRLAAGTAAREDEIAAELATILASESPLRHVLSRRIGQTLSVRTRSGQVLGVLSSVLADAIALAVPSGDAVLVPIDAVVTVRLEGPQAAAARDPVADRMSWLVALRELASRNVQIAIHASGDNWFGTLVAAGLDHLVVRTPNADVLFPATAVDTVRFTPSR